MTPDPLLLAAIRAVARSGDPDATLDELLEISLRAAGGDRAAAFLWDSEAGGLALAGARGYPPDDVPSLEAAAGGDDHPIKLAAEERIQTVGQPDGDGRVLVAWPIVIGRDGVEEPIGALALEVDHAPDADVGERVAALADLVAVVVDRARLATNAAERIDWAERVANSDALTGLANGRTLQRVLELELARAARQGLEISVALFDVDDLTGLNDSQGKAAGDDALREVAAVIGESVRFVDTVARWGGDEFVLVAPGSAGAVVARRVVDGVAKLQPLDGRTISISAGVAKFPTDGTDSDALLAAAEAAIQRAREGGQGQIGEAAGQAAG